MKTMKEIAAEATANVKLAETLRAAVKNTCKASTFAIEAAIGGGVWSGKRTIRTDACCYDSAEEKSLMYASKAAKRLWYMHKEFDLKIDQSLNPYNKDGEIDEDKAMHLMAWAMGEFAGLTADAEMLRMARRVKTLCA